MFLPGVLDFHLIYSQINIDWLGCFELVAADGVSSQENQISHLREYDYLSCGSVVVLERRAGGHGPRLCISYRQKRPSKITKITNYCIKNVKICQIQMFGP